MDIRHVVTCFLRHPDGDRVLLGQRSDRVRTYPGRWAAISGSVETVGPMQQAFQEIEEETGLLSFQYRVSHEGLPVRFADWDLNTLWVVHPFLFECEAPDAVCRDWEHGRFEWATPEQIGGRETVPRLREVFDAACRAPDIESFEWIFAEVEEDRSHGAEELGMWVLEGLKRAARRAAARQSSHRTFTEEVCNACRRALSLRPSMAAVRSASLSAYGLCKQQAESPEPQVMVRGLDALISSRETGVAEAGAAAGNRIPERARVVTISKSFTVLCALAHAADRIQRLVVAESRPACEGRGTAETAASFGIPTELVTDAAAMHAAADADVVLVGADSVLADGTVVNKTGTFGLCSAAARGGARVICVATESKIMPEGADPQMEEMDPAELGEAPPSVDVRNVYFERVPGELIGELVGPNGPLTPDLISSRAEQLADWEQELSGDSDRP